MWEKGDADPVTLNLAPSGDEKSAACPSYVTSKEKRLYRPVNGRLVEPQNSSGSDGKGKVVPAS